MRKKSMKKRMSGIGSFLFGGLFGSIVAERFIGKAVDRKQELADKHLALFLMMNQWVKVKQRGKQLSDYFEERGYHHIAVYGMGDVGETFVEELRDSGIAVKYGIDKKAENICADFNVFVPEDNLEKVDAIVVTSITFYNEIQQKLSQKLACPILSLEDILTEVLHQMRY